MVDPKNAETTRARGSRLASTPSTHSSRVSGPWSSVRFKERTTGRRHILGVEVDHNKGCWLWTGRKHRASNGHYGEAWNPEKSKWVSAHRYLYEAAKGPIPPGLTIDHLCRTTLCINPEHLEAVTLRMNVLRGVGPTAVNAKKRECPMGHVYNSENTRIGRKGYRECRPCERAKAYRRYWANPELARQQGRARHAK